MDIGRSYSFLVSAAISSLGIVWSTEKLGSANTGIRSKYWAGAGLIMNMNTGHSLSINRYTNTKMGWGHKVCFHKLLFSESNLVCGKCKAVALF